MSPRERKADVSDGTIRAHAVQGLVGFFGHVTDGSKVLASCSHGHRTRKAAQSCADRMAREALARLDSED